MNTCAICWKKIKDWTEKEMLELEDSEEPICKSCYIKMVAEKQRGKGKAVGLCHCGNQLYEVLDKTGKRIGITHKAMEDENECLDFWANAKVAPVEKILDLFCDQVDEK